MHTRLILRLLVRASRITLCLLCASKFSPASETTLRLPCPSNFILLLCNGLWPSGVRLPATKKFFLLLPGARMVTRSVPTIDDQDDWRCGCASSPTARLPGGAKAHSAPNHAIRTCLSWSFCILKDHVLAICYHYLLSVEAGSPRGSIRPKR